MRIITIEEHFHHPEVTARVMELAGPGPVVPDEGFGHFLQGWMPDRESAERLAGERLTHMDRVGIDMQVVSHGAGSPGTLVHAQAVELCRRVNDGLAKQIAGAPQSISRVRDAAAVRPCCGGRGTATLCR